MCCDASGGLWVASGSPTFDEIKQVLDVGVTVVIDVVRTDIEETVDIPVGFSPMVFFTTFDEFALKMEATYWQVTTNYQQIRERPQEFDLSILKRFNQTGLEFAFPTVTIVGEPADDPPPPSATVDSPN